METDLLKRAMVHRYRTLFYFQKSNDITILEQFEITLFVIM